MKKKYMLLITLFAVLLIYCGYSLFIHNEKKSKADLGLGYSLHECAPIRQGFINGNTVVRVTCYNVDCPAMIDASDYYQELENLLILKGFSKRNIPDVILDIGEQFFIHAFLKKDGVDLAVFKKCNDQELVEVNLSQENSFVELSKALDKKCD